MEMDASFNPSEAGSVGEQVDDGHNVLSDSVFRHDADNSATESPGAYLFKYAESVLQLN